MKLVWWNFTNGESLPGSGPLVKFHHRKLASFASASASFICSFSMMFLGKIFGMFPQNSRCSHNPVVFGCVGARLSRDPVKVFRRGHCRIGIIPIFLSLSHLKTGRTQDGNVHRQKTGKWWLCIQFGFFPWILRQCHISILGLYHIKILPWQWRLCATEFLHCP